jgi:ATP-dependent Clp protease ATP-binding subunit ClpA
MVREVQKRLEERDITFELTPEAGMWLAKEGFDPVYGARPLRRAIQRQLENPLARSVLSGDLEPGSHLVVDAGSEGITITLGADRTFTGIEPVELSLV